MDQPLSLPQPEPTAWTVLRKYLKILRVSLVERLTYRADFFVVTVFRFLPLVTAFLLWDAVFDGSGKQEIAGFTRDRMIAYLLLVQISRMFSSMPGLANGIARDIRDGNLKKYLLQPIDLLAYMLAYRGAHKMAYIATVSIPYGLLFWWFHEYIPLPSNPWTWLYYPLSLVLAFLIGFFFEACLGLLGFWLLEISSLLYIVGTLNFFVSGQMFPLDLFPEVLVDVLQLLPFHYVAYFPAMVFLEMKQGPALTWGLGLEVFWAVAFIVLSRWLYAHGLRRYSAFGG